MFCGDDVPTTQTHTLPCRRSRRIGAFLSGQVLVVAICISACASTGNTSNKKATPTSKAMARYLVGMDELMSGNYTEAVVHFQRVMRSPGYVTYSALARLRIGDALFLQEKYDAAIQTYRGFIQQYEANPNVGYARFRIGHAYFEQIPSDWFISPPAFERQQSFVRQASLELRRFLQLYPGDRLAPKAQEMLDDCERLMYEHELYVARFYNKRDKYEGVVLRLERAFRNYPDFATTEDNYMMLAQAYAKSARVAQARSMYEAYLDQYPDGDRRTEAKERLQELSQASQ